MVKKRKRDDRRSNSYPGKIDSPIRGKGLFVHVREVLMLSSLALLVFLIYSNTLGGPFIFDDGYNIKSNPHIRLTSLAPGDIIRAGLESPLSNRPVANMSFALNYYFHQYDVLGYHLVNILIHITTGVFLYLFTVTTLNLPALRSRYELHRWIPFITVFLWLVHPIQTQSVTYIIQRMNSMAAMFYVLSLLLYAKARLAEAKGKKRVLFAGCILTGILSLGSKEISATLPFFIFLYEWYFFQDLSWTWLKRHSLPLLAILIFFAIVALIYLGAHPLEKMLVSYKVRDFTLTQRVLTEFRVVIFYITLLIFPHPSRLNLDHDFSISHSLVDPVTTMLSIGAIVGLIGLAIYLAKKERLLSFCILWFLGNLVIESSVIGLEIIFEHRIYLPSMLLSLMAVTLAYRYIKLKWSGIAILCGVLMLFSFWTYERNHVWSDDETLWRDCVEKSPKKARPHNNLGVTLDMRKRVKEAISHFREALQIKPNYADAHANLGVALVDQGRIEEAMGHFSKALRINPDYAEAHYNLGNALRSQGKIEEAVNHFSEALRINPSYAEAHVNMGVVLHIQKRIPEAMGHFSEAVKINPDYAEAYNNLGVVLERQGRLREAVSHFSKALKIKPDYGDAQNNLGLALQKLGRIKDAKDHFSQAATLNPDDAQAQYNLGNALQSQGKIKEAMSHYSEALRIEPDYAEAHNNLGVALQGLGNIKEAMTHFSRALQIKPDYREAHNNLGVTLANQGRMREAMGHFSEALRINPDDAKAHYNLGVVLEGEGRVKKAASHYSEALRINPDDGETRQDLERVLRRMDKSPGEANAVVQQ